MLALCWLISEKKAREIINPVLKFSTLMSYSGMTPGKPLTGIPLEQNQQGEWKSLQCDLKKERTALFLFEPVQ